MPANWGGAASGAASGALAGSAFGPWGTAIGGTVGGLAGLLSGGGDKDKVRQLSQQTPEQQEYLRQILEQLQGGQTGQNYGAAQQYNARMLSGDPAAYQGFAAPYLQNFEQQIVPRLAERFAGLTGPFGNPGQSSGFGQAIGGAGAQLQAQLAGLYSGLQQNSANTSLGQYNTLANMGLGTRAFENAYQPGQPGFLSQASAGIAQGAGQGAGMGISNKLMNMWADKKEQAPASPPVNANQMTSPTDFNWMKGAYNG